MEFYSVGIIDMIKLKNIDNTYYTYNKMHTHICKLRCINNATSYGFTKERKIYIKEKKYVQYIISWNIII